MENVTLSNVTFYPDYVHIVDGVTPIERTMEALVDLQK
jgi:hypothetical protein